MADRYWVGGTATWDATAGTKWSATDGGAGGASVPTLADAVFFTALSGAVTCTVSGTRSAQSINCTGFTGTLAGTATPALSLYGSLTLVAGMTLTFAGTTTFNATATITSAGKTLGPITINGFGITVTLGDALNIGSNILTVTGGTFTTSASNYSVTAGSITSNSGSTRSILLNNSTVTLSNFTPFNFGSGSSLTFNAGTSNIICSASFGVSFATTIPGGLTFYNVSFTGTNSPSHDISSINTFNNLSIAGPASAGSCVVTILSGQTINGVLTTTGTAGNRRVWFRGSTGGGIRQTLTVNSAASLTDADFSDIYILGTAAPISGTRIGNLGNCNGITFSPSKTVYWVATGAFNWNSNAWSDTPTGTANTNFYPLAQDTATFTDSVAVTTVTFVSSVLYIGSIDMSARTSAMTISVGTPTTVYGNWKNGPGTTISDPGILTFSGDSIKTITSAGKTFSGGITVNTYAGSVELADALNIGTNTLAVNNGTFDTKNFNVTAGSLSSNNSNVRAITLGSSTLTLSGTSPVQFAVSLNLTFSAGTSQINLTATSGATFSGGFCTFYNVSFTGTTAVTHNITGQNTFNNLTLTAPASAGLMQCTFGLNQTITGTLTVAGATSVRRNFVRSDTLGTQRTLNVGTLSAIDCDFRDIAITGTAAGSSPTRAGDCGGNSGITFPAPKTVYWNFSSSGVWSSTAWATSSGGIPAINNFPLAQDTAVFDNVGSTPATITIADPWNIGTLNMSSRTSPLEITVSSLAGTVPIYGNWLFGTGITSGAGTGIISFSGRGTQSITSNGVVFNSPIVINSVGTVQLADGLSIDINRSFTLSTGTFDAVSYNVTIPVFISNNLIVRTLKMGSGLWTLTSTGTIWDINITATNFTLYKGTANILLSSVSTLSRTFSGAFQSYNKLTIGGTTGISTLTITGDNQFTELASTKTVAHTIALGTTNQTFGKWTVTGTAGNVVTITGTSTAHVLAGACTSGINYLAMGSLGFAITSPGEFYAGANSTGTATAPVYRTAKPADSTRYWVGGTGNWSSTTKWSTSSGGASGASVPRSHDDVIFNSASNATAYTATVDTVTGGIRMKSLTITGPASGNVTLAGSAAMVGIHGNVTLPATGLTRTYTGAITLSSNSTGLTFTTNGVALSSSSVTVNGFGCGWTLGSALNIGTNSLFVNAGSLDFSTYSSTMGVLGSATNISRSITLNNSTLTISQPTSLSFGTSENSRANLTFNAGTSQINLSSTGPTFSGNNQTFYNIAFTSTGAGTITINGTNSFNNLSFTGIPTAGLKNISLPANQTVTSTLTFSAGTDATMRHFCRSDTIGTTRTITAAAVSMTDVDFRDITIAGAAAPASGTRIGDCKGNSGITFPAAKTVYWNLAAGGSWGGAIGWATSSGGTPNINNFPLAQDTCFFEATGLNSGATVTINSTYNIGTINMSARTANTMTLQTFGASISIYGNWINGTGTTLSGTGIMTFAGRSSQTITSAGRTFTQPISINSPGGSVTFQDAFTTSNGDSAALGLVAGTLNADIYNVTLSAGGFNSNNTNVRTLAIGSGTWTIADFNGWNTGTSTNLTVTGTGTISLTSASAKTFAGGGVAYTNITLNQGGAGTLTITGNNTFKDITNTYKSTGANTINMGTTTQRVSQFTAAGELGRLLTLTGTSVTSPATLILTGAGTVSSDFLTLIGNRVYSLINTWYAGTNSTNGGTLGWIFTAAPTPVVTSSNFLMFFFP